MEKRERFQSEKPSNAQLPWTRRHPALPHVVALGGLLAVLAGGCAKSSAASPAAEAASEPERLNVKVWPAQLSDVTERVTLSGETLADARIAYAAEVAGLVDYMGAELGRKVRAGQVLARIDYASLKANAEEVQARYGYAKKTHERLAQLRQEDLATQDQLEAAQANLLSIEAQLKIARANLQNSVIKARRPGVVTRKLIEAGEYVSPGTPVAEVVDYRTVVVEGQLPESLVTRVTPRLPVKVAIPALGQSFRGQVDSVLPVADPQSRTFRVRVRVPNPELQILVGLSAEVEVASQQHRQVVLASQDVVVEEQDGRSVFIEKDGVVEKRPVRLGSAIQDKVILSEGVRSGDRVVVLGHRSLRDGQQVRVVQ